MAARFIRSPQELRAYRDDELTPERVSVRLASARGPVVLALDTGVGKSAFTDKLVARHRADQHAGVLIYLTSQRSVIRERPWVREHLELRAAERATHDVAVLEGRPRTRCGPLDDDWRRYEQAGCASIGRIELCGRCPRKKRCSWPTQRTVEALAGKRVVAATQTNLALTPRLISELKTKTRAEQVLVVLDEATLLETQFRRTISHAELRISREIFAQVGAPRSWLDAHDALLDPGLDLKLYDPPGTLPAAVTSAVQRFGMTSGERAFRFLGHDLPTIPPDTLRRVPAGIEYLARPWLRGHRCLILAAGLPLELVRHRLNAPEIEEYSPGLRFLHEGSRVFNISSSVGTAGHFSTHRAQILFAFAQLILRLHREGKRSLVVVKKRFARACCDEMQSFLRELGWRSARVVRDPSEQDVARPEVIPLITYGTRGLNRYEHFDAAFALCGYHARTEVLEEILNDVCDPNDRVRIEFVRVDGKRVATAADYMHQRRGYDALARDYQHQHETAIAEQALGRVRFAVHPRLVVFFQRGPLRYPLERDFPTLEAFRAHFDLVTRRAWRAAERARRVVELTAEGVSASRISQELGLSERQIHRLRANARRSAT